jgi:hypothetical protein
MAELPQHSKVGFSSRKRWAACPGSVKLSEGIPTTSSKYAEEGTAAHALQQHCLLNKVHATSLVGKEFSYEDHGEQKSIVVLEGMATNIQGVLNDIRNMLNSEIGAELRVEDRLHLHQIHEDLFGTGDVIIWLPSQTRLVCRDLKYGAGVAVDIEDEDGDANPQLEGYALGALLKYPEWHPTEVEIIIDQPRAFHVSGETSRRKVLPVSYFVDMAADIVDEVKATERATEAYGKMQPIAWEVSFLHEGSHCRWCPAAPICPLLKSKAQLVAKKVFAPAVTYDPKDLSKVLDWLPILEAWIKNVREFAYAEAEQGRTPPQYKLVEKEGRSKWRQDIAVALADALDIPLADLFEPAKLKGITDIKKLAPGTNDKERAEFIGQFTTRESSGHALVHESDKRAAVQLDAKSAFKTIEGN